MKVLHRTLTKSKVLVSTVSFAKETFPPETCVFTPDGKSDVIEKYKSSHAACIGHFRHVKNFGGRSFWDFFL